MTKNRTTHITIAGLVVGTLGIAILWAAGQKFPFYPPPGIVILLAGALVIGLTKVRWAPAVGAALGLFVTLGTLISPDGLDNLAGKSGAAISFGQALQALGVVTALVAGIIATRNNYRSVGNRQA
jgi:MFS superfamily sulfate permease-like transporter